MGKNSTESREDRVASTHDRDSQDTRLPAAVHRRGRLPLGGPVLLHRASVAGPGAHLQYRRAGRGAGPSGDPSGGVHADRRRGHRPLLAAPRHDRLQRRPAGDREHAQRVRVRRLGADLDALRARRRLWGRRRLLLSGADGHRAAARLARPAVCRQRVHPGSRSGRPVRRAGVRRAAHRADGGGEPGSGRDRRRPGDRRSHVRGVHRAARAHARGRAGGEAGRSRDAGAGTADGASPARSRPGSGRRSRRASPTCGPTRCFACSSCWCSP